VKLFPTTSIPKENVKLQISWAS